MASLGNEKVSNPIGSTSPAVQGSTVTAPIHEEGVHTGAQATQYKPGDTFKGSDGVTYTVNQHMMLVNNYGHPAPQKIQYEFQQAQGIGPLSEQWTEFKQTSEFDELEEAWNSLSPGQQNSFIATNPTIAGIAGFIEGIAPIPLLWLLPDGTEVQIRKSMERNPEIAGSAEAAGTVVGLIGGPLVAAKAAKGLIKYFRKHGAREAGFRSAAQIKKEIVKIKKEAAEVYDSLKKKGAPQRVAGDAASKIWRNAEELQDFLNDWGEFAYDQRRSIDEMRDFLGQRTNGLSPKDPLVKALGGPKAARDVFDSWWDRKPAAPEAASGWLQDLANKIRFRGAEIKANAALEAVQFGAGIVGDMAANFKYSYYDWKSQGYSDKEAAELAWKYTLDRTPSDLVAEGISDSGLGKASAWGKFFNVLAQLGVRASLLLPDLGEGGQVRPDVYFDDSTTHANRGGYILRKSHPTNNVILGGY